MTTPQKPAPTSWRPLALEMTAGFVCDDAQLSAGVHTDFIANDASTDILGVRDSHVRPGKTWSDAFPVTLAMRVFVRVARPVTTDLALPAAAVEISLSFERPLQPEGKPPFPAPPETVRATLSFSRGARVAQHLFTIAPHFTMPGEHSIVVSWIEAGRPDRVIGTIPFDLWWDQERRRDPIH